MRTGSGLAVTSPSAKVGGKRHLPTCSEHAKELLMADNATQRELLDSLAENARIKAAVLFDQHGNVRDQVGSSRVVGTTDRFTNGSVETQRDLPKENVYLIAVGSDFLLTVFDEHTEFERVKTDVKELVERMGFSVSG
mgnify:CR=1 FL=1